MMRERRESSLGGEVTEQRAFAVTGVTRCHVGGGGVPLFGSSVRHTEVVRLRVGPAELHRTLNRDWIMASGRPYLEVDLSLTQWAELVSSFGQGDGVPCTLRRLGGEAIPPPDLESKRAQFTAEFRAKAEGVARACDDLVAALEATVARPGVTKAERRELAEMAARVRAEIGTNMPFVADQFQEQMDRTVGEARGEVEAFFARRVIDLGLEALVAAGAVAVPPIEAAGELVAITSPAAAPEPEDGPDDD